MKVLLFTHKIDIDGMGCAVLGKLAYNDINVVYCDTFEINQQVQKFIDDGSIYDYDKIFVTDLCIKQPLISQLAEDDDLNEKIVILDHHKTEIEEGNDKYSFSTIIVQDEKGKCSGTSLFYNYLLNQQLLRESEIIKEFVELTRQYDTWEWKTKFNNEKANELNILFSVLKREKYVETFFTKLEENTPSLFNEEEIKMIEEYKKMVFEKCSNYISQMKVINIKDFSVGVIDNVEDEYRNDIAETIKTKYNFNIDLVALIISGRNTISFRSIKQDIDVGAFASFYGGKGHKEAASCPKTEEIINLLRNE